MQALAVALACDASVGGGPAVSARDSAGIDIVESHRPRWSPGDQWRVGAPAITIGAALAGNTGQQLDRVVGATRLSDATIVVADAGARALLRYDASGRYLGSTGRAGDGPGEFRALAWIGRIDGDSIITWDPGLNRMSVFTSSGEYLRDFQPATQDLPSDLAVMGRLDGGRLLLIRAERISLDGNAGVRRLPISGSALSPNGAEAHMVGPFPGEAVMLKAAASAGGIIRTSVPFGAATLFAARGEAVYVIDTEAFELRVYTDEGTLVRIVRWPGTRIAVTPEDVEVFIEERLARVPPIPEIREGSRRSLEAVPPADTFPAVRGIHVDSEDYIWIEAGRRPADANARWSIFDPDGRWLGDLALPASMTMLEIGTEYVLARSLDDLDVQRVVVMPLDRPRH